MWPHLERPWYGIYIQSQAESLQAIGVDLEVQEFRGYVSKLEYVRAAAQAFARGFTDRYDVVHAHYSLSGMVARAHLKAPLILSYCGDDILGTADATCPAKKTPSSRVMAASFAQLAWVTAATITKSEEMERHLPRRRRVRNHVIPNGVDLQLFAPRDRLQARAALGWDPAEKVAVFVANPKVPGKGYALAEAAYARAQQRCPDLRLRTAWGSAQTEIPTWMNAADALIFPSWAEGSPNAVKEAMACELPIVATPVGDIPERLHGIPGCHVVPPDEERLASALLEAVHHGRTPEARVAVEEFSLEAIARRVLAVYESVAN